MNRPKFISSESFFVGALFAAAFILRLCVVSAGPFHPDTVELAICSEKTLATGVLHYQHSPGYPLTVLSGAAFVLFSRLLGVTDPVLAVNAMSVFWGAVGVVLFYFLVRVLLDPERARGAALFLAVFTPHLAISTFGKSMTLSFCLYMMSAILLWHGVRKDPRLRVRLASAVFFGFMLASRLSDGIMIFSMMTVLWVSGRSWRVNLRDSLIFLGTAGATALLAYIPLLQQFGMEYFTWNLKSLNGGMFLGFYRDAFFASWEWFFEVVSGPALILALGGVGLMIAHRRWRELLYVAVWFSVGHYYYGNVSTATPYYFSIVWTAGLVPMGYFWGTYRGRFLRGCAFVLAVSAFAGALQFWPALVWRHERSLLKEFSVWVGGHGGPGDVVVAIDQTVPMQFYSGLEVFSRPVSDDPYVTERFLERIDEALGAGRRVFVIGSAVRYKGEENLFCRNADLRYRIVFLGEHPNEDWHHVLWHNQIYFEELFELRPLS